MQERIIRGMHELENFMVSPEDEPHHEKEAAKELSAALNEYYFSAVEVKENLDEVEPELEENFDQGKVEPELEENSESLSQYSEKSEDEDDEDVEEEDPPPKRRGRRRTVNT